MSPVVTMVVAGELLPHLPALVLESAARILTDHNAGLPRLHLVWNDGRSFQGTCWTPGEGGLHSASRPDVPQSCHFWRANVDRPKHKRNAR